MIDLQKLADMPGYGNAAKALKKAGKWDEWAGMEYGDYSVNVSGRVFHEGKYLVKARSEQEAIDLAADKFCDEFYADDYDDMEVNKCN